jgi:hypothetical protein
MVEQILPDQREIVLQQAYMLRECYPDLFDYLVQRDKLLQRSLQQIPDPTDPEAWTTRADFDMQILQLKRLPPGVKSMAETCEQIASKRSNLEHPLR